MKLLLHLSIGKASYNSFSLWFKRKDHNEDSVQCVTWCTVTHMKCSKMDKDSLEYLKTVGKK
ncbi:hypothetical protein QTP88_027042 [Uroleucon formosanum]